MRDLREAGSLTSPHCSPTGIAFAIADLVLAKSWAGFHDCRLTIRLDHGCDDEEYEEVLEFRQGWNSAFRTIVWRNEDAVFVQPLVGRRKAFHSVATALESLQLKADSVLTDIPAMAPVRRLDLGGADAPAHPPDLGVADSVSGCDRLC